VIVATMITMPKKRLSVRVKTEGKT